MAQNHLIQRLTVELDAPDPTTARKKQDEVSLWLKSDVFLRRLSGRLDEVVPQEMVLQIPRLEIDVTAHNEADFQAHFIKSLLAKIEQVCQKSSVETVTATTYLHQSVLYFLKYGYLPPTSIQSTSAEIRHFLMGQNADFDLVFWEIFQQQLAQNPQMLSRLAAHLGIEQATAIFCQILKTEVFTLTQWVKNFIQNGIEKQLSITTDSELAVWNRLLLDTPTNVLANEEVFRKYLQTKAWNELQKESAVNQDKHQEAHNRNEEVSLFVENAGLVLLTPFFAQLFQALDWTKNNVWRSQMQQHQAVRLLDYLAKGTTDGWEHDWTLNKLLCGLPLETVIEQAPPLHPETLQVTDDLLKAVINHWTVLKNTSPQGLRNMFLQRKAKLSSQPDGNGWRLQVARKTEDVLIERIPWGFSVIKLPWMQNILFVEW